MNGLAGRQLQSQELPSLRRTISAPPSLKASSNTPPADGFPAWNEQAVRKAPDLDALYGSARPPRAKPGKASGIQAAERDKADGMVKVHPARIILNPRSTPDLSQLLDAVRRELQDGGVFKWTVARNGAVMLAPYKLSAQTKALLDKPEAGIDQACPPAQKKLFEMIKLAFEKTELPLGKKLPLGHPTLVGGLREPEARMGGELRHGKLHPDDAEPVFYINNDSGRYSEYSDRSKAMLANVARHFGDIGFPVEEQWMDKSKPAVAATATHQR